MRILQINEVCGTRSTGRITKELADYLNTHGHEGYIAYSVGSSYYRGFRIGNSIDKKAHALLSRIFGKQAYYSKLSTYRLLEYIRAVKPDVVHLGNLHGNFINLRILLQYLAKSDIATVLTLHDCWFYTGKCTHYTIDQCSKWKNECGSCPRLSKDNKSWFFDYTSKMINNKKKLFSRIPRLAVVGVSDWIVKDAKESILSSAKIISRIYNWIDFEQFRPVTFETKKRDLGIEGKFIILGVASKWSEAKGINRFLELSKRIDIDEVIVIVGEVGHNFDKTGNLIHIPETNNVGELVTLYSMADVFLNLSLEESFGKVSAEALACGTPVITNSWTANPELIREGCGYVVKMSSLDEVIESIKVVKLKTKLSYSHNCIQFAKSNFSKCERIEDYISLYSRIIDKEGDAKCQ